MAQQIRLPPQPNPLPDAPHLPRNRPKGQLDIPEPRLTEMLERLCDLRGKGHNAEHIRAKNGWTRNHYSQLLDEANRRSMPYSQDNPSHAFVQWLLDKHDAGDDITAICRLSAHSNQHTRRKLQKALDANSGSHPENFIVLDAKRTPRRVSWRSEEGRLYHRAFDGAFPPNYPMVDAVKQTRHILLRLASYNGAARQRALTMVLMAEAGLASFDYLAGQRLYTALHRAGLDDDAKRTVIGNLHEDNHVTELLLRRCGVSKRWLTGNKARTLSRQLRAQDYPPAITRTIIQHLGNDPASYYMIGAEHRIPTPSERGRNAITKAMLDAGFNERSIDTAIGTLGVPPSGHHPPKRRLTKRSKPASEGSVETTTSPSEVETTPTPAPSETETASPTGTGHEP